MSQSPESGASDPEPGPPPSAEVWWARLRGRDDRRDRYQLRGEVGRGGMGVVHRVWDGDLRRTLAMKVLSFGARASEAETLRAPSSKALGRFLEEAQVTGQLEHPGVVPVHEVGATPEGHPFFTMRLVKGRDLHEIFDMAREHVDGWNSTRAVGALVKVCETISFAHEKGVLHRDLKPANVRVGSHGEVYVMDWGLARVIGRPELRDIRIHQPASAPKTLVHSDRRSGAERSDSDEALYTMDGDVVGTPAYMSPEQARGEIERLDVRSDVYSIGAMLYHLLSGRAPYTPAGHDVRQELVLVALLNGPPTPLAEIAPDAAVELVAICEKAMARDPAQRYPDVHGLGDDLRAYLETRVVQAYASGPIAELLKWVRRNRAFAAALVLAFVALATGLGIALREKSRADRHARDALESARVARIERGNVLRLSAFQDLDDLRAEAGRLWPLRPELAPALESWIARARRLVAGLDPGSSDDELGHRARLAELEKRGSQAEPGVWTFSDDRDRWWHTQLQRLIESIQAFADPATGWIEGLAPEFGWGVQRRLAYVQLLNENSMLSPEARASWALASAEIADRGICPAYAGMTLAPQIGLLPIGRDPRSGLWEFAELSSGAPAVRGSDGALVIESSNGIVFVLLPGGRFSMGGQSSEANASNYDRGASPREGPVHEVDVGPFFLSKYELTQAQWRRFTGNAPSYFKPESAFSGTSISELHPVEQISHEEAATVLGGFGLLLPSEEQWEYAARAGTTSAWASGPDATSLEGYANLNDADAVKAGVPWRPAEEWLSDGFPVHSPVGSFEPNAFGLHDMHGNLFEWCSGTFESYLDGHDLGPGNHVMRGGSFADPADFARCSLRGIIAGEARNYNCGARAARSIDPH